MGGFCSWLVYSVLQCVAVCCSVLQCVAVCCSVLQCDAVCCSVLQCAADCCSVLQCVLILFFILVSSMIEIVHGVATISRLLKLIVFFAKEPYKRDYILQNRPILLRNLLIVATPPHMSMPTVQNCTCMHIHTQTCTLIQGAHTAHMREQHTHTNTHLYACIEL